MRKVRAEGTSERYEQKVRAEGTSGMYEWKVRVEGTNGRYDGWLPMILNITYSTLFNQQIHKRVHSLVVLDKVGVKVQTCIITQSMAQTLSCSAGSLLAINNVTLIR